MSDIEREDNESPDWAGSDFGKDKFVEAIAEKDGRYERASNFLRASGLIPNSDAIEQLADVFLPCLAIMCQRGYANDGSTWQAGGWRGLLHEMIKKMDRVQYFDWYRAMPEKALREIPDIINYAGMYQRARHELKPWGDLFGEPGNWNSPGIPEIVTLCGSTRFAELFQIVNLRQTIAGRIVLSIGCDSHSDADLATMRDMGWSIDEAKPGLDELHKRKIDLSNRIIVISDDTGYIGDSTASEINYAIEHGKPVEWLTEAAQERFYAR
jgi:hypothetical protein